MRPDKKKKVHHDSRKKADKAKQALNEQGHSKEDVDKVQDFGATAPAEEKVSKKEEKRETRVAKVVEEKKGPAAKNISSNWTKFEIPSSGDEDENEDSLTGLNFNFVRENKVDSSAQFRFKSEREWEEYQNVFTSEFFSLDLKVLEQSIACIPLKTILNMNDDEFDTATLARLNEETSRHKSQKFDQSCSAESLNQTILDKLSGKDNNKEDESSKIKESENLNEQENEDPDIEKLLQSVDSVQIGSTVASTFAASASGEATAETKNLEDWLDDFLSD